MRLHVKGKNVEVSDAIHEYAERKLGKLSPQLAEHTHVELELAVEKNPSIADNHIAEATIFTKGPVLRAREASSDMKASIDVPVGKVARQVKRYRQKRRHEHERHDRANGAAPAEVPAEEGAMIVKTKQFVRNGRSAEEAVEQLE